MLVRVKKEKNFVSYPFLIPKKEGDRPRFIVDYGHLKERKLYEALSPILPSPAAVATLKSALVFAKIDLRDAFYTLPLPKALHRVSTLRFGSAYYQFRRLPMGLFLSPYLLQTALQALLAGISQSWVHIDDILLWGKDEKELRSRVTKTIRLLHSARFRINLEKSVLAPRSTVKYCGLLFAVNKAWDFTADKLATLQEVLRMWDSSKKKRTQCYMGFLAYVLSACGLSLAWAKLMETRKVWRNNRKHKRYIEFSHTLLYIVHRSF